jgi:hypothetical protein
MLNAHSALISALPGSPPSQPAQPREGTSPPTINNIHLNFYGNNHVYPGGGGGPGTGANWSIYPDIGWVGVILSNCDGVPLLDICLREAEAVTGAPVNPPGGG